MYEGELAKSELVQASKEIENSLDLVDWSPCSIKCGVSDEGWSRSKRVFSLCNSTGLVHTFKRIDLQFQKLYSHRGFCHWYMGEGLESGFMPEMANDMDCLIRDIQEMEHV